MVVLLNSRTEFRQFTFFMLFVPQSMHVFLPYHCSLLCPSLFLVYVCLLIKLIADWTLWKGCFAVVNLSWFILQFYWNSTHCNYWTSVFFYLQCWCQRRNFVLRIEVSILLFMMCYHQFSLGILKWCSTAA